MNIKAERWHGCFGLVCLIINAMAVTVAYFDPTLRDGWTWLNAFGVVLGTYIVAVWLLRIEPAHRRSRKGGGVSRSD